MITRDAKAHIVRAKSKLVCISLDKMNILFGIACKVIGRASIMMNAMDWHAWETIIRLKALRPLILGSSFPAIMQTFLNRVNAMTWIMAQEMSPTIA